MEPAQRKSTEYVLDGTWFGYKLTTVGRANSAKLLTDLVVLRTHAPTTIMSNERLSDHTRIRNTARSFKGKSSSLLQLSRAPTSSSIDMDPSSDNGTK
jgi:hypothetical protein